MPQASTMFNRVLARTESTTPIVNASTQSMTSFKDGDPSGSDDSPGLKKQVGLVSGVSLIVGTMIGSGIFVSPAGLALGCGSVGLSLILWAVCGGVAMIGALCLAELGTLITESGGEYAYIKAAFGSVPAYLFSWMSIMLLKPAACSIVALTCAEYIMVPAFNDGCGPAPPIYTKVVAASVVLLLTAANCLSVQLATRIQVVFTVAKISALLVIIIGGFINIAMDVHSRNLPLAILLGIPLVTVLYLLVNVSYFSVMSVNEMVASNAVAVTWTERTFPLVSLAVPVAVAISTFGGLNGCLFGSGRLTFVAARDGHMMKLFSFVHVRKDTPSPSLVLTCVLAIAFMVPGDISSLIDVFNFAVWLFYGLTMLALIVLRYKMPDHHRPYKVPVVFAYLVLIVSVFLVVAPIVDNPQIEFVYASIFIVGGLVFYMPFVYYKTRLPYVSSMTVFVQLLLQVTPPVNEPTD